MIDWTEYQRLADAARARFRDPGLIDYTLDAALRVAMGKRGTLDNVNLWLHQREIEYSRLNAQRRNISLDIMQDAGFDAPDAPESRLDWQEIDHRIECSTSDPQRALYLQGVAHFLADGYTLGDIAARLGGSLDSAFRAKRRLATILA